MKQIQTISTLYIDFDSFFASVEQQLVPKFRGRPMGVLPLDSPYSGFIAVSREAKALGIKRGARLIDVRKTYPDILAAVARHDVYIRVHHKILQVVGESLPIHKVWSIDEVECRLLRNERNDWRGLAAGIRANLAREIGPYITPSIGFGANQVLAKIAAEMDKPNGLVCLHPKDMPGALYKTKLGDIPGVGRRMQIRLNRVGINSMQQLMGLSGKQMRALWRSVEGERLWAGLHGYQQEKPETERRMFGHGRVLAPDWRNYKGVRNCARLLLVKAARRLRRQNFAAGRLAVSVGFNDKTRRSFEHRLPVPAIDDQALLAALEIMLARLRKTKPAAMPFKVSVCLYGLIGSHRRSGDLLETKHTRARRERWEHISGLVDELNGRHKGTVISMGTHIEPPGGYAGGKIAFGRIPDMADFL